MFAKNQAGVGGSWHSVAEEYDESGIELDPGDNAMQASLDRCGTLLWADPQHPFPAWHPQAGQGGAPAPSSSRPASDRSRKSVPGGSKISEVWGWVCAKSR